MVRVDIWQLVEEDLFTDALAPWVPVAWWQNTDEWIQGDGSAWTPIKLDINWLVAESAVQENVDFVVVYDVTAWLHRKVLIADLVPWALQLIGEIDASTNPPYPASPEVGDTWIVTVQWTVWGETVEVWDQLIYSTSGWFIVQTNITQATTFEAVQGTALWKYMSPQTATPNNYPVLAGAFDAADAIKMRSVNDWTNTKVSPQQIADLAPNIYTADGTLTWNRVLDGDGLDLTITNANYIELNSTDELFLESSTIGLNALWSWAITSLGDLDLTAQELKISPNGTQWTVWDVLASVWIAGEAEWVNPSTLFSVPIWPTVAVVSKNWDNATGQVGDASKPFLTIEAANAATPLFGMIIIYPGTYNVTLNTSLRSLYLIDATLTGSITWNFLFITGTGGITNSSWFTSGSNISANISANTILMVSGLSSLTGLLTGNAQMVIRNISLWTSPWNLLPQFVGSFKDVVIQDIWKIECDIMLPWAYSIPNNGSWLVTSTIFKNIWSIECTNLATNLDWFTTLSFNNIWSLNCSWDVITVQWTAAFTYDSLVEFNNVNIKTDGYVVSWPWATAPDVSLRVIGWGVLDSAQTENVNRPTNPQNKLSLIAPRAASRVSWDWGSWVVNDLLGDTLVNSAITLW